MKCLATFLAVLLVSMAATPSGSFNGSSTWIGATNLSTFTAPWTFHAKVRPKAVSGTHNALAVGGTAVNAWATVGWTTFFGSARWYCDVNGDYSTPSTTLAPSTNAFASVILSATSATVRAAYLNGTNFWSGDGSSKNPTLSTWSMGCILANSGGGVAPFNYANCEGAEYAVWTVALTAGERAALDAGISPLRVRPQSLVVYVPAYSTNFQAIVGRPNISTNVGTLADHPRIYR